MSAAATDHTARFTPRSSPRSFIVTAFILAASVAAGPSSLPLSKSYRMERFSTPSPGETMQGW